LLVNIPWSRHRPAPLVGETLNIEPFYSENGYSATRFDAVVTHVGLMSISAEHKSDDPSIENAATYTPKSGTAVVATFVREYQLYSFESAVQKAGITPLSSTIVLSRPKRVVKVQRRFFYRVPMETRTTFRLRRLGAYPEDRLPASIINISEGGMLITTGTPLQQGALIEFRIPAGVDGDDFDVVAEVLDSSTDLGSRYESTIARLRFDGSAAVGLTDALREKLVKYLFEQQRLMLQARRLLNGPKK
jgi:c-di-GMP-binding flagellar brake protein YcgR